MNCSE